MKDTISEAGADIGYFASKAFLGSLATVAVASLMLWVIKQYLIKKIAYTSKNDQHKNTFVGMIFNVMQYLVVVLMIVLVLKLHGVNVASILAGLGIMATIIGLALQDTLKDIISGINIYNNNFYKVGDMVRWNGEECDVKYFSARVTKFQSLRTNSTYTVCNSAINQIEKIKDRNVVTYTFSFDADKKKIDKVMDRIVERMALESKDVKKIYYDGICSIDQVGVGYEIKFSSPAHKAELVRDRLVAVAYEEFKKAGVHPLFNSIFS